MSRITAQSLVTRKGGSPIVCLTAYDECSARLADAAGVDLILVGDSVGCVMYGYSTTIPVTLDDMVRHTQAARVGCKEALLVADLPFGSYQSSVEQAVDSAVRLVKAGAAAVKLEGTYVEAIAAIVRAGIPVMGHVGMTPQSYHGLGGHRVQGRQDHGQAILAEAAAIQEAGAFAIVLELIEGVATKSITNGLAIPTIGIGSGVDCDGQVQVFHDLLGLSVPHFKHAKRYLEAGELMGRAIATYVAEVRERSFPGPENTF